jgi:hypothetical protein
VTRQRRWAALGLCLALPVAAFFAAPGARADDSPGADLAGLNATAYGSGLQISPLTPGLVGAGNVARGNLVEAAVPYASAGTATGPSNTCVASPAYPGDTAAGAGNALSTFAPQLPAAFVNLLNYPVLARADYPAQVTAGSSSTYSPPGGTGAATASASATVGGANCQASTSSEGTPPVLSVGSATASSQTVLTATSVSATGHSDVGSISLLGGLVSISGIVSDATASSDGTNGQVSSNFGIASVKVAGQAASIGPQGLTLDATGVAGSLIPVANQALVALAQAGISVHTVSPVQSTDGAQATVTSGGLVIDFEDQNVPNPEGQVPVSSVGLDLNVGFSYATADATALPPLGSIGANIPSSGSGSGPAVVSGSGSTPAVSGVSGPAATAVAGPATATNPAVSISSSGASTPKAPPAASAPAAVPAYRPAAAILGVPVKVAWVVIAAMLSLVASGPLLGYANWQLLRGRRS